MFCYQCEQVSKGKGCTVAGVCGKKPEVAALQDLLTYALKGVSLYASEGRKAGMVDQDVNRFTIAALFATLTNVNFDPDRLVALINRGVELREGLKERVKAAGGSVDFNDECATFTPEATVEGMVKQGEQAIEVVPDPTMDADVQSVRDILLFGLKGVGAYAYHAQVLGQEDDWNLRTPQATRGSL